MGQYSLVLTVGYDPTLLSPQLSVLPLPLHQDIIWWTRWELNPQSFRDGLRDRSYWPLIGPRPLLRRYTRLQLQLWHCISIVLPCQGRLVYHLSNGERGRTRTDVIFRSQIKSLPQLTHSWLTSILCEAPSYRCGVPLSCSFHVRPRDVWKDEGRMGFAPSEVPYVCVSSSFFLNSTVSLPSLHFFKRYIL